MTCLQITTDENPFDIFFKKIFLKDLYSLHVIPVRFWDNRKERFNVGQESIMIIFLKNV